MNLYKKRKILKKRPIQDWMLLSKDEICNLTDEDWQHYSKGGCLCSAFCDCECVCGAWHEKD